MPELDATLDVRGNVELAVKAQASIVTWNVADFKKAASLHVQVMSPRQLLEILEKSS